MTDTESFRASASQSALARIRESVADNAEFMATSIKVASPDLDHHIKGGKRSVGVCSLQDLDKLLILPTSRINAREQGVYIGDLGLGRC